MTDYMNWKPIETAPKYGTEKIDIFANGRRYTDCS